MQGRRKKRICDSGLRTEETIYTGDGVVFLTPIGQVAMAVSIKKVTTPGFGGMVDWAEIYVLDIMGTSHREIYDWNRFIELNKEYEV